MTKDRFAFYKELDKLKKIHPIHNAAAILMDWTIIIGTILLFNYLDNNWLYPVCLLIIGGRMMALWCLLHDGHHYMLFRNRTLNRVVTVLFISFPLFKSLAKYDELHSKHHQYLRTPEDPLMDLWHYEEYSFPMPRIKLYMIFLKDLLGYNFIKYKLLKLRHPNFNRRSIMSAVIYLAVFSIFYFMGAMKELLIFWVIPYITWFSLGERLTIISDHFFNENSQKFKSRSIFVNVLERFLIAPHNFSYHAEHHLFGNIPWYNLKKLRKLIRSQPELEDKIKFNTGYASVIRDVTY